MNKEMEIQLLRDVWRHEGGLEVIWELFGLGANKKVLLFDTAHGGSFVVFRMEQENVWRQGGRFEVIWYIIRLLASLWVSSSKHFEGIPLVQFSLIEKSCFTEWKLLFLSLQVNFHFSLHIFVSKRKKNYSLFEGQLVFNITKVNWQF